MNRSKKGALMMLVVVVFWATMPASACLLGARRAGQPDCCRAMAQDCPMRGMGMNTSCCRIHEKNAAVTPIPPYSSWQSQELASVPHQVGLELPCAARVAYGNALESPPLKFPPGGAFALRI